MARIGRLLVVALILLGCGGARLLRPDQITKIVISVGCLAPCASHQTSLFPDGHYTYSDFTPGNEERGQFLYWSKSVKWLEEASFFAGRTDYSTLNDPGRETTIYVAYDSTSRSVTYDTTASDVPRLRTWVNIVDNSSVGMDRLRAQHTWMTRLTDYPAMRSVEVQRIGCYGSCPRYDVTFGRDGIARMRYWLFPKASESPVVHEATASVDFSRAVRLIRESQFWTLQPHYPLRWIDTEAAKLVIRYDNFTFTVDAPDSTTRSAALNRIIDRVDQLVEDVQWQPGIPAFYEPRT